MFSLLVSLSGFVDLGYAVVIQFGDGSGNTTAPSDDPGFANVGKRGGASAIYLGNRWVLTAAHVGAGSVVFHDLTYQFEAGTEHRLDNSGLSGLSELTDMVLFRLTEAPDVPGVYLSYATPELGSTVTMIGNGRDRQPNETFWRVTEIAGEDNDVWTETTKTTGPGILSGFHTLDSNTVRWGTNVVGLNQVDVESGWGGVASYQTTFEKATGLEFEAQGVTGDSGGAAFRKNGPLWELSGLIHSVSLEENQPGGPTTAVYRNDTFIADLSKYAAQLRTLADFGPAPGDFDRDGLLSLSDIDLLSQQVRTGSKILHFDLNGDYLVDEPDRQTWLSLRDVVAGDADLNGDVSFSDFVSLANHFALSGGWGEGDFDGNGMVEFGDFVSLANNFGTSAATASQAGALARNAAVPEPSAVGLLSLALLGVVGLRVRNAAFSRRMCGG